MLLVVRVYGRVFRFKLWFDRQSPLMRGVSMIAVSVVTLIVVGFVFAGEVTAYLEGDNFGRCWPKRWRIRMRWKPPDAVLDQ